MMMFNNATPASVASGSDLLKFRPLSENDYLATGVKRSHDGSLAEGGEQTNMYETKKYHRLIEKRRRDRINECIYQLKDLLPKDVIKSTTRPMEKAVILELVVQHMQFLDQKRRNEKVENDSSNVPGFEQGYRSCMTKVLKILETTTLCENQKNALKIDLQENIIFDVAAMDHLPQMNCEMKQSNSQHSDSSDSAISISQETPQSAKSTQAISSPSSSLPSSSLNSDNSICSDSSSSNNNIRTIPKVLKRKMFSHHRSNPQKHQTVQQNIAIAPANTASSQTPIFINMPFMMNPGVIPSSQFVSSGVNGPVTEMPRMIQPNQVQIPSGVVMPQISSDVNGVQFPTIFMACGPQSMVQMPSSKHQTDSTETKMVQPTIMMPMARQGNFFCMPSFPMMTQIQTPTLVPVQTSSDHSSHTE